jgi:hypothetical protein
VKNKTNMTKEEAHQFKGGEDDDEGIVSLAPFSSIASTSFCYIFV